MLPPDVNFMLAPCVQGNGNDGMYVGSKSLIQAMHTV